MVGEGLEGVPLRKRREVMRRHRAIEFWALGACATRPSSSVAFCRTFHARSDTRFRLACSYGAAAAVACWLHAFVLAPFGRVVG